MNAIVLLYKRVINYPMGGRINDMCTYEHTNVPVVMTREEVAAVLSLINGSEPSDFARHLRDGRWVGKFLSLLV